MATRRGTAFRSAVLATALFSVARAHAESKPPASEVASATAPAAFAVRIETTKGAFVIEAYRSWAPQAADRFYNLVRSGYLDGNLFYRVNPKDGVDFGLNGDAKTTKTWLKASIPCDPPRRKLRPGDVFLLNNGTGDGAAVEIRIQTGADASAPSRSGAASFGRVVEGDAVLASLDASHMQDTGKWSKMIRHLLGDGNAAVVKDFPKIDSVVHATLLERTVEPPADDPAPAAAAPAVPPGMALVRVYRPDPAARKFTLRVDGAARAVLSKGSVFEASLPAGRHELSTKVKFKMFATGLGDKMFAARDTFVAELEPGRTYHVRSVPVGDGQTLQLYLVANDVGAEESLGLEPAAPLQGPEEDGSSK